MNKVIESRKTVGKKDYEGKAWERPAEWDDTKAAHELGIQNQTKLSGSPFNFNFCPHISLTIYLPVINSQLLIVKLLQFQLWLHLKE